MSSCLYKLTTGNFVTNKTLLMLKFARSLCNAESRCRVNHGLPMMVLKSQYCTTSKNISPSSMWNIPVGYFLAQSWAVRLGGGWELAFLVEETVGPFTKLFIGSAFTKFYPVFNERNHVSPKSWQLRLFFTPITLTNISHSGWLI